MCQLTKKKICLVACGLQGGGQERIVSGLANHYCRLGHRVSLLLLFQGEHFYRTDDRIRIYEPALDRSRMNKYRYMLALISYIRKTLKEIDPGHARTGISGLRFGSAESRPEIVRIARSGTQIPVCQMQRYYRPNGIRCAGYRKKNAFETNPRHSQSGQ